MVNPAKRKRNYGAVVVFATLLLSILLYLLYTKTKDADKSDELDKSIAVLPFLNLSSDLEQQFFADGVMEDILTHLQRMGELRVISRTSVERFRKTDLSAKEIGDALNVTYLLEGSVRRSGEQIMVTAQLINATDDQHLWAENFTSTYTAHGLFDIQRTIARNIVKELKLKISPDQVEEITKFPSKSKAAYEHYQKGWHYYKKYTLQDIGKSREEFKSAIRLDSTFGLAYGGLANTYMQLLVTYFDQTQNWKDSVRFYARKGLQFDESCAECYKVLGQAADSREEFIEYSERAILINPNFTLALGSLEMVYRRSSNLSKSLPLTQRIIRISPDQASEKLFYLFQEIGQSEIALRYADANIRSGNFHATVARIYAYFLADLADVKAGDMFSKAFDLSGDSLLITQKFIVENSLQKDYKNVTSYYEQKLRGKPNIYYSPWVAYCYNQLGNTGKSRETLRQLQDGIATKSMRGISTGMSQEISLARTYAQARDNKMALELIEKAIDKGYYSDISVEIFFQQLRRDSTFESLAALQKAKRAEAFQLVSSYNFPKPEDL